MIDEFEVARRRRNDEHDRDMVHAYNALAMQTQTLNKKRMPSIDKFLAKSASPEPENLDPEAKQEGIRRALKLWADSHNAKIAAQQAEKRAKEDAVTDGD